MGRLDNKVAIVSGAGSIAEGWSNGKATAVVLAREGASVFAVDRNPEAAEETRAIIEGEGGRATAYTADVTSAAEVNAMAAECLKVYGRIDILFNNVGLQVLGGPLELAEEDWDRLMTVNVKSMYLTCRAVIPAMLDQGGGSIVNNASVAGHRYTYNNVGYSASKGAVRQLTQNIGVQYASKGIRCNAVLAGYMATPRITDRLKRANPDDWEEVLNRRLDQVPAGRFGTGWDVAHAVAFLASDEAAFITGTDIVIDGGQSASAAGNAWGG
ncbi:glucose 1-dehydrogenase [Microbaculum marinum]|uniref:Glucose 1-dehydrogenase n=1 Tax=Microbaculum marinum TaxID=1764581 RepID=A0AAW9RTT4_9HYPH